MYEYLAPDGKRYPADLLTLQEWARNGRITPESMLIHADTGSHMPAGKLIPLQPHFAQRSTPPSSPAPQWPRSPQSPHPTLSSVPIAKKPVGAGKVIGITLAAICGIPIFVGCMSGLAGGGRGNSSDTAAAPAPAPVVAATPRPQTAAEKKAAAAFAKEAAKQQAAREKAAAVAERAAKAYEDSIALRGDDVVLKTGYKARNEEYSTYITGTVVNESDHALRYAEVKFEITDAKGNAIESAMDNITYVAPKGTWKFKCTVMVDQAFRYRPVSVESSRAD